LNEELRPGVRVHNWEYDYNGKPVRKIGPGRWLVETDRGVPVEADEHHLEVIEGE
jgi:hypothetical protein